MPEKSNQSFWELRKIVLPQHTDHAGVMWHGAYFAWLEEARIQALIDSGMSYSKLSEDGFEMPVVSLDIKYKVPLLHGDFVCLQSFLLGNKPPRWKWKTIFYKGGDISAAIAIVELALIRVVDGRHQIVREPPASLSKVLHNVENGRRMF